MAQQTPSINSPEDKLKLAKALCDSNLKRFQDIDWLGQRLNEEGDHDQLTKEKMDKMTEAYPVLAFALTGEMGGLNQRFVSGSLAAYETISKILG